MRTATTLQDLPGTEEVLGMSGLDFMQGVLAGTIARPPISVALNYHLHSVEKGHVVFHGTPGFDQTNLLGGVHGGWYGTLLDSCMACAIMTIVPKGAISTTLEYKVNLTRAIPLGCEVAGIGIVDHAGRSTSVARGEIRGVADGKLYATGTTTCLVMQIKPE